MQASLSNVIYLYATSSLLRIKDALIVTSRLDKDICMIMSFWGEARFGLQQFTLYFLYKSSLVPSYVPPTHSPALCHFR